jgi:acetyl-CoA acyltransferase
MIVPMTVYTPEGWVVADLDQQPRPDTTMEGLGELKTPFRPMGKVTPGNASGLNDGACGVLLMSADKAKELQLQPKMRLVAYTYVGVRPEVMGLGPIPATHKVLKIAGLTIDHMDFIELNEAFAVQCIAFMEEFKLKWPDEPRLNPLGGAIAFGHPLASSGPRLMVHLMHEFAENAKAKYGLSTMCVGLGQGGSVIWENLQGDGKKKPEKKVATKGKKKK